MCGSHKCVCNCTPRSMWCPYNLSAAWVWSLQCLQQVSYRGSRYRFVAPKINMVLTLLQSGPSLVSNRTDPEKDNCWCKRRIHCGVLRCWTDTELCRSVLRPSDLKNAVSSALSSKQEDFVCCKNGLEWKWRLSVSGRFSRRVDANCTRCFSHEPRWYGAFICRMLRTFRDNLSVPSSRDRQYKKTP